MKTPGLGVLLGVLGGAVLWVVLVAAWLHWHSAVARVVDLVTR